VSTDESAGRWRQTPAKADPAGKIACPPGQPQQRRQRPSVYPWARRRPRPTRISQRLNPDRYPGTAQTISLRADCRSLGAAFYDSDLLWHPLLLIHIQWSEQELFRIMPSPYRPTVRLNVRPPLRARRTVLGPLADLTPDSLLAGKSTAESLGAPRRAEAVAPTDHAFNRTPGPPLSSAARNVTPAASSARPTASTLSAELRPGPAALSMRRIVGRESPDSAASLGPLQSTSARAARI